MQDYISNMDPLNTLGGDISNQFLEEVLGSDTLNMEYGKGFLAANENVKKYILEKTSELIVFINSEHSHDIPNDKYIKPYFDIKEPESSVDSELTDYHAKLYSFLIVIEKCILPKKIFSDVDEIYSMAENIYHACLLKDYVTHLV